MTSSRLSAVLFGVMAEGVDYTQNQLAKRLDAKPAEVVTALRSLIKSRHVSVQKNGYRRVLGARSLFDSVLEFMSDYGSYSTVDVARGVGLDVAKAQGRLIALVSAKKLDRSGHGRYVITRLGSDSVKSPNSSANNVRPVARMDSKDGAHKGFVWSLQHDLVLGVLQDGKSKNVTDLARSLGLAMERTQAVLIDLAKAGDVVRAGVGTYRRPTKPRQSAPNHHDRAGARPVRMAPAPKNNNQSICSETSENRDWKTKTPQLPAPKGGLSADDQALLRALARRPMMDHIDLRFVLGWSRKKTWDALNDLTRRGRLAVVPDKLPRRWRLTDVQGASGDLKTIPLVHRPPPPPLRVPAADNDKLPKHMRPHSESANSRLALSTARTEIGDLGPPVRSLIPVELLRKLGW
ncbi:MAG: hypothetical protein ACJATT_003175 [Myxococcota bacterium]|jgi:DNA-binding IclR family transcriptional regulator